MATRRIATATTAGVLRPDELARHVSVQRTVGAEDLALWVEYHWTLHWDLPADTVFRSSVIPGPACHISVEHGASRPEAAGETVVVTGVTTRRFDTAVSGCGWVHGLKLRPGALVALAGADVRSLTDRTVPAVDVLPRSVCDALCTIATDTDPGAATHLAEEALRPLVPVETDPSYDLVLTLVTDMLGDPSLLRVDDLAARHHLSQRTIERLFARYVGVGPKWVLARYRMHNVVTALDDGYVGSLADLASTYGWYDQAHFGREFTKLVGVRPSDYRAGN